MIVRCIVRKRVGHWTIHRAVATPVPDRRTNPIQSKHSIDCNNPATQCPRMLFLLSVEPSKSHIFHLHVNVFSLKCRQNLLHTCILFTLENIIDADNYNVNQQELLRFVREMKHHNISFAIVPTKGVWSKLWISYLSFKLTELLNHQIGGVIFGKEG